MYEFLKKLFGTVDGQPEALTYEQLEEKIKGDKNLKIVNLADGGYVASSRMPIPQFSPSKIRELMWIRSQRNGRTSTTRTPRT